MPASHTHSVPAGFLDGKDDAQTRAIPVLLLQQTHPVFAKRLDSELFFAALADRDATKDCRATLRYLRFWVLRRLYWVAVFCDGRSGFNECGARWTVVTAFRHPSPLLRREGEPVAVAGREPAAGLALVGDAAFCPSLLAGQGSALAMIGAYVLAGELGRAGRSPEEAFRRYERLLHPFMLTKQNAAEKFASSFAPKTRLGLFARNQVTKVLGVPFVTRRVMGSTLPDRINLPDYSENTGPQ